MGIKQTIIPACVDNNVSYVDVSCKPVLDNWDLSFERPEDQILFDEFFENPHQASVTFAGACTITGRVVRLGQPSRQVSYFLFAATIERDPEHPQPMSLMRISDNELRNHVYTMYADARSHIYDRATGDSSQGRISIGWYEPLLPAIG